MMMSSGNEAAKHLAEGVLFWAAAILAALIVRVPALNDFPWFDEMITVAFLGAPDLGEFLRQHGSMDISVPPVYHILAYGWACLTGTEFLAIRMLSLIFGLAGMVALYALARDFYGKRAAQYTVILLALNPFHAYHSTEIRMYSLIFFLAIVAMYSLMRYVESGSRSAAVVNAVVNVVLANTHTFSITLIVLQMGLLCVFRRPSGKRWILLPLTQLGSIVSAFVWIWTHPTGDKADWLPPPKIFGSSGGTLQQTLAQFAGCSANLSGDRGITAVLAPFKGYLDLAILLFFLVCLVGTVWIASQSNPIPFMRRNLVFLLLWLVFPLFAHYAVSVVWRPVFWPRYMNVAMPAVLVIMGIAIANFERRRNRIVALGLIGVLLSFQCVFLVFGLSNRPDLSQVARQVEESAPGHSGMVVLTREDFTMRYAFRGMDVELGTAGNLPDLAKEVKRFEARCKKVWVFFRLMGLPGEPRESDFLAAAEKAGLQPRRVEIPGDFSLRLFLCEGYAQGVRGGQ